ncbi:MAG: MgtC/SapB family protein [Clostridioides sp.]|jgi:putative Mg2+ transporter-C (MgtC) family protein|nr:MgtC/SapB family protein [Clostridioides sp.]
MNTTDIIIKLLVSLVLGGLVGMEREKRHQFAGFRTHILIALGACISSIVSIQLVHQFSSGDPTRIPGQVLTGIGFLGAGTILKTKTGIKGLTTAAGVWTTACIGIAIGCGFYKLAVLGCISIMLTLHVLRFACVLLDKRERDILRVKCDRIDMAGVLDEKLKLNQIAVKDIHIEYDERGYWNIDFCVIYDKRIALDSLISEIRSINGVISAYYVEEQIE